MIYVFLLCYIPMLITQLADFCIPAGLLLGVLSVYCLFRQRSRLPLNEKILAGELILLPLLCGLYLLLGFSDDGFRYVGQTAIFSIGALSSLAVLYFFPRKERRDLFVGICVIFLLNLLFMAFLGKNALDENDTNLANHITGAPYCNSIMIFSGICFALGLQATGRMAKLLLFGVSLLSFAVITVILQRAINAILCLFMLLLLAIFSSRYRKLILAALVLFVLVFVLSGAVPACIKAVCSLFPGDRLANRLKSIADLMTTGEMSSLSKSILLRFAFLQNSINTWLTDSTTFIIGYGSHSKNYSVISGHSDILDTFAKYGLVGGLLLVDILRRSIIVILRKHTRIQKYYTGIIIAFVILWGVLGGIFRAYTAVMLFVALPISAQYAQLLAGYRPKPSGIYAFARRLLTKNMFSVAERDIHQSSRLVARKHRRDKK
ncbi:MAG: hypothetical protein IK083_04335 [Abditibacteriota bacterium]|nr:hypothetical protein [Abditibacteriota bacterium]